MRQELGRGQYFQLVGSEVVGEIDVIERFALRTARLCSDQHHTVASPRPINGGGGAAFQDIDRFDIVLVDIVDIPSGDAVDHIQRPQAGIPGGNTPELQAGC